MSPVVFRAGLLALCAATAFATAADAAPKAPVPASAATPALPRDSVYQLEARMVDQHGHAFDWRTARGRPQVVSMFYTSCQYMCPLIVDSGKAVEKQLSPAELGRIRLLLISMDPAHDTPQALAGVATKRKLDPARWTLARPQPRDVRTLAGVLGVRYRQLADGNFNHTSALVLLDADGRIVARTEQVGSKPDPDFIAAVHRTLAAAPAPAPRKAAR